ncbi:MAG TPA: ABC transporter ATP-binding protein [Mycobacteriales bacterium]|nr:ABC transporter ATP-binding protein [Mycobacteriales bacterium]
MTALLEVEDIDVRYGAIRALSDVSLTVADGEVVTLLGANGAGKSTTLRTISGLLRPTTGDVRFEGRSIVGVAAHEIVGMGIGHVPEGRHIFPRMSVDENLEMGAFLERRNLSADRDRVFGLFPRLAERRKQLGGTLSGGEQQMLAIGRALMGRPRLLLLDEPSMGLAPLVVKTIFEVIATVSAEGVTVLLVEQNAAQALRLAARGYVLETGRVAMADDAQTLLADDRVRQAYLGEDIGS